MQIRLMLGKEILCIKLLKVSCLFDSCKQVVSLLCLSDDGDIFAFEKFLRIKVPE